MAEAYIVEAVRTAGGRRNGRLAGIHPADLAGDVLTAVVARAGIDPKAIDDVILGCVTQAGEQAFAFARNAVLASSLPSSVPAVTVDRQCGSAQQALQFAAQAVMSGTQELVIAGGAESMSRVPMFSNVSFHQEAGLGNGPISDRIKARFQVNGFSQFDAAEALSHRYGLTRDELDEFALVSHQRAAYAQQTGAFAEEIVPILISTPNGYEEHRTDEGIRFDASRDKIASVKPLAPGGVITAANASQIADGASAVIVASEQAVRDHQLKPVARIHAMVVTAGDPVLMLEEPIFATKRILEKAGLGLRDIDLFEVNEAFASVPLAWLRSMEADPTALNVYGGAIALGHPLGSSGTRIVATLVHALRRGKQRYGLQTMCEAGGVANATIIEAL